MSLKTCEFQNCHQCELTSTQPPKIKCDFHIFDLLLFYLFSLPSFFAGGYFLFSIAPFYLWVWLIIIALFFFVIEIRVLCSHCPHYAETDTTLSCWANYGIPKIWRYRPGPMCLGEKIIFIAGLLAVWAFPAVAFIMHKMLVSAGIYLLMAVLFFVYLHGVMCIRCMNFSCPFNRVRTKYRAVFLKKNPLVKEAWKI